MTSPDMNLDLSTSLDGAASSASAASAPADPPASVGAAGASASPFEPGPNHEARLAEVLLALEEKRNPFLEAASVLLRTLAELPEDLDEEGLRGLQRLLSQELHTYTRLCEQAKGDGALRALLACGNAVLGIDHWSQGALGDDAPNLGPLMHLLGCLAAFAEVPVRAEKLQVEDVESDGLRPGFQAQLVGAPTPPGDPVEARWSAPLALPAAGATHAHIVQEREQIRALLRHIRHWVERHEPSSPVTILLKQADRMWGRRFAEVAHMIPSDLMQAWDRDD